MRSRSRILSFSLAFRGMCVFVWGTASMPLCFLQAEAATITVGPAGDCTTIQEAVNAANEGDEVVVSPGVYVENVLMTGRNITLRSTDPDNASVVETTIIDGNQAGTTLTLEGSETEDCVVEGLTIRNGLDPDVGGVQGNYSMATIRYNRIIENRATTFNGAIRHANGLIQGNFISDNESGPTHGGGGIGHCDATIIENVIVNNIGHGKGGGIHDCSGARVVSQNIIANNWAVNGGGIGGATGALIDNNMIYGNFASDTGGAISNCGNAQIVNNTFVHNQAAGSGGAIHGAVGDTAFIVNNIFYENSASQDEDIAASVSPEYCCFSSQVLSGPGNIGGDPAFEDAANNDFHLTLASPCVDAGRVFDGIEVDYDAGPRPLAGLFPARGDRSGYDIGADEFLSGGRYYYLRTHISGEGRLDPLPGLNVYMAGSKFKLVATPADGWSFERWNGDATGSDNPLSITMDSNKVIEAVFINEIPLLYTEVQGKGSIYPPPGRYNLKPGTEMTLTAIAASGWHFTAWDGDIAGSPNPVTVKLDKYTTAIATFVENDPQTVECPMGATSPAAWGEGLYVMGMVMAACWAASRMYVRWRRRSWKSS